MRVHCIRRDFLKNLSLKVRGCLVFGVQDKCHSQVNVFRLGSISFIYALWQQVIVWVKVFMLVSICFAMLPTYFVTNHRCKLFPYTVCTTVNVFAFV